MNRTTARSTVCTWSQHGASSATVSLVPANVSQTSSNPSIGYEIRRQNGPAIFPMQDRRRNHAIWIGSVLLALMPMGVAFVGFNPWRMYIPSVLTLIPLVGAILVSGSGVRRAHRRVSTPRHDKRTPFRFVAVVLCICLAYLPGCAPQTGSFRSEPRRVKIPSGEVLRPVDWWCEFVMVETTIDGGGPSDSSWIAGPAKACSRPSRRGDCRNRRFE